MYSSRDSDSKPREKLGKTDENMLFSFLKSLVFLVCISGSLAYIMSIQP